jgi:hypothetical protein
VAKQTAKQVVTVSMLRYSAKLSNRLIEIRVGHWLMAQLPWLFIANLALVLIWFMSLPRAWGSFQISKPSAITGVKSRRTSTVARRVFSLRRRLLRVVGGEHLLLD